MQYLEMANSIRFLAADAVNQANSGHPGMPLGMADVATVLFSKYINLNPQDPRWFNRDRFVLSAGHGSMLLYALLYLTGYADISLEDLKNFRQLHAKTAGHPEYKNLAGIDITTGPLGQGLASAVGMAIAERFVNARFGDKLCNHYTYVINGDGCLMEGISQEAAAIAGHLRLNKLIVFWDNNNITIDGTVQDADSTDQICRFKALGWNTLEIDGHNYEKIEHAIETAQNSDKPTLISCKTTIGFGAPNKAGTPKAHGSPLGQEETDLMRQNLNWNYKPFEVPQDALKNWRTVFERTIPAYNAWVQEAQKAGSEFTDFISNKLPEGWNIALQQTAQKAIDEQTKVATRKASQMCLAAIVPNIKQMIGGSADLAASNLTFVEGMKNITWEDFSGNNIKYGIREHAMAAIMNGLTLHGGTIVYGGTFFVFSDYMRPAMRLAALMGLNVVYVLTHDSIGVGEDGPTHQPVEQLASYRAMPNINVFRPCDVVETAESWEIALTQKETPSLLALSRQNLPMLRKDIKENLTQKGAYVIRDVLGKKARQATVIATGSEVSLAVEAQTALHQKGIEIAVVSMPCAELFDRQPKTYQKEVLGTAPTLSVEAGTTFGWSKYAKYSLGIDSFGLSGPAAEVYAHFKLTVDEIIKNVEKIIK